MLKARQVNYSMPTDAQAFITEWKGKPIDGKSILPRISLTRLISMAT